MEEQVEVKPITNDQTDGSISDKSPIDVAATCEEDNSSIDIFKEIAKINGEINRMSFLELRAKLKQLGLEPRGKMDVLKKRLKAYAKKKHLTYCNISDPNGDPSFAKYLIIIDFEATCDVGQPSSFKHEIIEFPAILLRTKDKKTISEFHSFVKPVFQNKLSTFCTSLTGITQDIVDKSPIFPEVLGNFEKWLDSHKLLRDGRNFTVVADGPWDMGRFLVMQCEISQIPFPKWGMQWINLRKSYSNFYDTKRICLKDMLLRLGMTFEGQPHRGIDDSRNIARITSVLLKDGANLRVNERLKEKAHTGMLSVVNVTKKEFEEIYLGKKMRSKPRAPSQKSTVNNTDVYFDYFMNLDPPIQPPANSSSHKISNRHKQNFDPYANMDDKQNFDPYANMADNPGLYEHMISSGFPMVESSNSKKKSSTSSKSNVSRKKTSVTDVNSQINHDLPNLFAQSSLVDT